MKNAGTQFFRKNRIFFVEYWFHICTLLFRFFLEYITTKHHWPNPDLGEILNLAQKNVIFQTSFSFRCSLSKHLKEHFPPGNMLKAGLE